MVITPSSPEFQPVREAVASALTRSGIQPVWVDQFVSGEGIVQSLLGFISAADFVVADLTGLNPNVLYEVGFAQGLRKRVLLIAQPSRFQFPSDLVGSLVFFYDLSSLAELHQQLSTWVPRYFPAVA